jgi:GT2 family glycosyltransferase
MILPDGRLDPTSCLALPSLWHAAAFGLGLSLLHGAFFDPDSLGGWKREGIREVPALTGGLMLIDAKLWRKLGGFDERFFLYGEDVDLCMRARQIGARPLFTDACTYIHRGGASSATVADRAVAILTGKATLYRRHLFPLLRPIASAFLLMGVALRSTLERVARPNQKIWRDVWSRREEWRQGWR